MLQLPYHNLIQEQPSTTWSTLGGDMKVACLLHRIKVDLVGLDNEGNISESCIHEHGKRLRSLGYIGIRHKRHTYLGRQIYLGTKNLQEGQFYRRQFALLTKIHQQINIADEALPVLVVIVPCATYTIGESRVATSLVERVVRIVVCHLGTTTQMLYGLE